MFFTPTEFLRKLSMLIPPPRRHLVRFHGVFAPNSGWRKQIVPACPNVLECERCGGEMKVLALVTEQAAIKKILEHLDLPSTGPPIAKARRPPEFDFVA